MTPQEIEAAWSWANDWVNMNHGDYSGEEAKALEDTYKHNEVFRGELNDMILEYQALSMNIANQRDIISHLEAKKVDSLDEQLDQDDQDIYDEAEKELAELEKDIAMVDEDIIELITEIALKESDEDQNPISEAKRGFERLKNEISSPKTPKTIYNGVIWNQIKQNLTSYSGSKSDFKIGLDEFWVDIQALDEHYYQKDRIKEFDPKKKAQKLSFDFKSALSLALRNIDKNSPNTRTTQSEGIKTIIIENYKRIEELYRKGKTGGVEFTTALEVIVDSINTLGINIDKAEYIIAVKNKGHLTTVNSRG